ncbi:LysR family hydrogen peroxide-inducible transcriptional activator [Neolewinella xylanilytica]|uniref:LysR family hydrogen peroxide-inducible transcriptional activator n=1 Tax=Neolewinella xylanilytica TaxID=1514080 RepID=A0A2S6I4V9_9BACT|nr:LysR substrate-binding domain-containing protein [Neolewinella xylanilytica]PPK86200.1 LysR family hydrogen peroxide-inducible transcriptional activator [Neolewinella xylanilytica]
MTLQQLRYLLALDEHRHFGKAARSCFVAQPTLTLQVKKLEDELGVIIFDRSANPVQPTRIGYRIVAQARLVLEEVANLETVVASHSDGMEGVFSVGVIPTLSPYLLPRFIKGFSARFPDTRLRFREMRSEEIIEELRKGSLDIGLLVTPLQERQLREIPLFYEPFLIYASAGEKILERSPLLPDHVNRKDLWILQDGHCFRNQVLNLCEKSAIPPAGNFHFEAGTVETLKNLVRSNMGYTIIPELSVNPATDADFTRRFADPQPSREVSLVVNRNMSRETLLTELRKAILSVVPAEFTKNERYRTIEWRN